MKVRILERVELLYHFPRFDIHLRAVRSRLQNLQRITKLAVPREEFISYSS